MTQKFWVKVGLASVLRCHYDRSLNLCVSLVDIVGTQL